MVALNPKNFGLAGGIIWGAGLFILVLISLGTGFGADFLARLSKLYIGMSISIVGAIIGGIWAFIDAFAGLYIFAWLYNWLEKKKS